MTGAGRRADDGRSASHVGRSLVLLLAFFALITSVHFSGEVRAAPISNVVTGSFVGAIPGTDAFVAIVAGPRGAAPSRSAARAYVCNGRKPGQAVLISEWFNRGSIAGDDLQLSSEEGAKLKATLTTQSATGTVTSPNGTLLHFVAKRAAGIAGLYVGARSADGETLHGSSATGARLQGRLGGKLSNGLYPITVTITTQGGQRFHLKNQFTTYKGPTTFRFIVLPDGRAAGTSKGKTVLGFAVNEPGF